MQSSESEFSKSSNYSRILKLIYSNQKISKQEIATSLNLSLPTVTTNLQLLEEDDLIYINGKFKSSVGRRAIAYSINAKKQLSLGLELNKEHINLVALDLNGGEVANSSLSLKFENTDTYFDNVCQWISLFIKMNSFNPDQIIQIGISIPGLISHDGQTVLYGKIMDCTGLTTKVFTDRLPYAIMFFHDADCVAVAEQFLSHSHDDAIYLSINDHIGTAIIINDHIYTGQNGRSGTLEHVKLNADSKRHCYCGRYGCVETYCSINSLLTQNETLDQFMDKLNSEDPDAQKRWDTFLNYLAEAINNFHMFLDNRLIIAGELSQYLNQDTLTDLVGRIKQITAFPDEDPYLSVGIAVSKPVATGAALPAVNNYLSQLF